MTTFDDDVPFDPALDDRGAETVLEPWDDPVRQAMPEAPASSAEPKTLAPIFGIPAAIGTSEDVPLTHRAEYLGQSRAPIVRTGEAPGVPESTRRPDPVIDRTNRFALSPSQEHGVALLQSVIDLTGGAASRAIANGTAPATIEIPPSCPPAPIIFDPSQAQAIRDCGAHRYTNISGTAGVGKTFVAKAIVSQHPGVTLAATTGIASVNLGEGTTINALLRYFDTRSLKESYTSGHLQSVIRKLRRAGVQRILIDEKSMMAGEQLTYIARAVREVNEGGIYALETVGVGENDDDPNPLPSRDVDLPEMGITLVGDFGQLPPVPDQEEYKDATGARKFKKLPVQYAFDSPEWPLFAAHTTTLTRIYRQDAQDFVAALHAIRKGNIQAALQFFTPNRFSMYMDDAFQGSTIFAKNDAVDRHNLLMLDTLPGAPMIARAARQGEQRGDWRHVPDELRLKEGALVMILANRREYEDEMDERGRLIYANGDLGTLLGTKNNAWLVRLQRTGGEVLVYPVTRENTIPLEPGRRKEIKDAFLKGGPAIEDVITERGKGRSEIIGTITYMPLRAAYGCTVHKTQGLTLDRVQVNIRDPFFQQPGMLFVALSRARTAEGLRIVGDARGFAERCRIEPRVQPWL